MTIDEICDYLESIGYSKLRDDSGYNLSEIIPTATTVGYYLTWDAQHCSDGIFRKGGK